MSVLASEIQQAEENGIVTVTVALPAEAVEFLRQYAQKRDITMTEALRLLISNEKFLNAQVDDGGKVLIQTKGQGLQQLDLG